MSKKQEKPEENQNDELFGLSQQQIFEMRKRAKDAFFSNKQIWRQRGFWLVCVSMENKPAIWLGPDKIMVGEKEDGTPILANRENL